MEDGAGIMGLERYKLLNNMGRFDIGEDPDLLEYCPVCGGRGQIDGKACDKCYGSGVIYKDETDTK